MDYIKKLPDMQQLLPEKVKKLLDKRQKRCYYWYVISNNLFGGVEMIAVNKLKGEMVAKGFTQEQIANILGITPKTLRARLSKGVLDSDEIETLIRVLAIENPMEIFFAQNVT